MTKEEEKDIPNTWKGDIVFTVDGEPLILAEDIFPQQQGMYFFTLQTQKRQDNIDKIHDELRDYFQNFSPLFGHKKDKDNER